MEHISYIFNGFTSKLCSEQILKIFHFLSNPAPWEHHEVNEQLNYKRLQQSYDGIHKSNLEQLNLIRLIKLLSKLHLRFTLPGCMGWLTLHSFKLFFILNHWSLFLQFIVSVCWGTITTHRTDHSFCIRECFRYSTLQAHPVSTKTRQVKQRDSKNWYSERRKRQHIMLKFLQLKAIIIFNWTSETQ